MQIGVARSYAESFFSFKDNKILIKLKCPVFQILIRDLGLTLTSKKVEFRFTSDLLGIEFFVMGRKIDYDDFKKDFCNLKSKFWLSTEVDITPMDEKLRGMAKVIGGKSLFLSEFPNLIEGFYEVDRYANQQMIQNKGIIKDYCEKNIDLINNQIRLLSADKNMYTELMKKI